MIVTTVIGLLIKFTYYVSHGFEAPNRRLVKTFTSVKIIDANMQTLPIITSIIVRFISLPSSKPMRLIE